MRTTSLARALAGLGAGVVLALAAPLAASAHVTVSPNQAAAGSWTYVTFRVPNESPTASTVALQVHLPADTPFTSVSYQPTPGWSGTVATAALPAPVKVGDNTITEAASTVTFTADAGSGVAPGQFQLFTLALGPVPDTGHIVLPATQTYSDGKVVEWSATPEEAAKDDTAEPAPVLWVNDAPPAGHHGAAPTATAEAGAVHDGGSSDGSAGLALGLSIAALVVAVGGALVAGAALGRRRSRA